MCFANLRFLAIAAVACFAVVSFVAIVGVCPTAYAEDMARRDDPRPIDAAESLWTEELTWMEVRDAIKAGKTTIIIGTGGVEQNGPYVATGKHNYVLEATLPAIATELGNALIAPIVKFVPEGHIEPEPQDHMRFSGTISLEEDTFEALLTDICRSFKQHGFTDIILVGDSGGNQAGMENVAKALNTKPLHRARPLGRPIGRTNQSIEGSLTLNANEGGSRFAKED